MVPGRSFVSDYLSLKSERIRLQGVLSKAANVKGSTNYKAVQKQLEEVKIKIKDQVRDKP